MKLTPSAVADILHAANDAVVIVDVDGGEFVEERRCRQSLRWEQAARRRDDEARAEAWPVGAKACA
ncbi:MAG: hypothetical protein HC856_01115 [Pseudanabaena sp. RU_4_16]|nr:hypothetical protein [Pseudanabaena sp. RU_4_16]